MRQHWWEYTRKIGHKERACIIEVCVYSSLSSMRRGILRHKADASNPEETRAVADGCIAMCRSWQETINGRKAPVSRLFFCKKHFTAGIIAHEALHASMHAERTLINSTGKFIVVTESGGPKAASEEILAELIEAIVGDVAEWRDTGYPDEVKK
jgi:hypothetical protein